MTIDDYVKAAKVPRDLLPWRAQYRALHAIEKNGCAFLLDGASAYTLHLIDEHGNGGYTIMEDSDREIRRHMAAIVAAKGRVLKTGLGFGCFVRACLIKPEVEHIDVVEIDRAIVEHFGKEFEGNPRVTIHHCDAFKFPVRGKRWNLGWHDIYCDGNEGLQRLHVKLIRRFHSHCDRQGAWGLPRWAGRAAKVQFVGSPRLRVRPLETS